MINTLLNAIQTAVKAHLTELNTVGIHGGRFNLAELNRIATKAPAVFIAALGNKATSHTGSGQLDIDLQLALFIVTRAVPAKAAVAPAKPTPPITRLDAAANIAGALMVLASNNRWGLSDVGVPEQITSNNLYNGDLDKHGIALWAVGFNQTIRIGDDIWADDGTLPSSLYIGIDPETGKNNEDKYQQVAP